MGPLGGEGGEGGEELEGYVGLEGLPPPRDLCEGSSSPDDPKEPPPKIAQRFEAPYVVFPATLSPPVGVRLDVAYTRAVEGPQDTRD